MASADISKHSLGRRGGVARRLLLSFLAVLAAFALTLGYGAWALRRTANDAEMLRSGYVPLLMSLGSALENQNMIATQLNHITEVRNPDDARRWIETSRKLRPEIFAGIRRAAMEGARAAGDRESAAIARSLVEQTKQIEAFLAQDSDMMGALFDALRSKDEQASRKSRDEVLAHEVQGARRVRQLKVRVEARMDRLIEQARERERRALHALLLLAMLTVFVGLVMTWYAHRVLRPLGLVTQRAHAVAAGDLTPQPVIEAKDELGELAATFESMVAAISKANEDRLQAERLAAVGRMAAHVAHEIRNPLSSIGLNLEMLEEELALQRDAEESVQLVRDIRREVDHLSELSEEYLGLARRQQPRLEPERLSETVRDAMSFVKPDLDKAGVSLVLDIDETLPDALVDEVQIRQVLLNLVRNAREAMNGSGTLTVRLKLGASQSGPTVRLVVEDDGPGIDPDIAANVFDPFFTTKNRGTGLGLAITRQVIASHGGTIRYERVEPHGARFVIELPAVREGASSGAG